MQACLSLPNKARLAAVHHGQARLWWACGSLISAPWGAPVVGVRLPDT